MRWLFLFVLVLNIVYVAWELSTSDDGAVLPKTGANVEPILLLSELGKDVELATPEDLPGSAAQDAATSKQAGSDRRPGVTESEAKNVETCFTLGPFRKLDDLRAFTRSIKDYVVAASFRSREEQEQSMYWVFLPPAGDYNAAKALGKRLKSKNIADYYVISKGDHINGVSLGHFKERDRAFSYADRITGLGFKPSVEPVYRTYTIYWLDYRVMRGKVVPDEVFDQHRGNNVKLLHRTCPA